MKNYENVSFWVNYSFMTKMSILPSLYDILLLMASDPYLSRCDHLEK